MKTIILGWKLFLDLFFPRECVGCGISGQDICKKCYTQIPLLKEQHCPLCNKKNLNGIFCNQDCKKEFYFDQLIVCSEYHQSMILKKLIWFLKYRFSKEAAKALGRLMKFQFAKFSHERDFLICYVPLSKARFKERGFNQAQLLANYLAKRFNNLTIIDCLERVKDFQHQAELGRMERLKNIAGAFRVKSEFEKIVAGKNLLLIDDVTTTYSTLNECAKVLKQAGASYVCGLVLARSTLNAKIQS